MKLFARILRGGAKLRLKALGLATIKDIPTEQFNALLKSLIDSGWLTTYVYDGFDAWIDYGQVKLKKDGIKLNFEWDNWTEGSVEGPANFIKELAATRGLGVTDEWRWTEYDEKP
jgi:hypothetical protein